ncbi:hypothetical protein ORV05_04875 [Amycolatopsis cynarae]|uniref:DUF397 domain-containing protein n=1 Tax=Amycolatopsis cynarae TaxID=2995223 RepID=A0ABY7B493_9PSEU|nr:hypothetical protein [Amycolatopsis sp. HUAS 11-8]WAL67125.1 hypothetical protein ORV05_04875 [Amycolatopsis sp. HUAS 11-8]
MPVTLPKLTNVSNPASFGVEWVTGESESHCQMVNIRGTSSLLFGIKVRGTWSTTPVVNPGRFGLTRPPKTFAEFRAIAEAFISAAN